MGFFDSVVSSVKSAASSAISSVSSKISGAIGGLVSGAMGSVGGMVSGLTSGGGAAALKKFASSSGALGAITSSVPKSMANTFSFSDSKAILATLDLEGKLGQVSKLSDMNGDVLDKLTSITGKSILSDGDLSSVTDAVTGKFADISFPNSSKLLSHAFDLTDSGNNLIDNLPGMLGSMSDNLVKEYKPLMSSTMDMLTSIPDSMDDVTFSGMADSFTNGIGSFCTDTGLTNAFTKAKTGSLKDTAKAFLSFAGKAMDYDLPILSSFPGITEKFKLKDVIRLGMVAKGKGAKEVLKSIVSEKTASFIDDPKKYSLDTVRNIKLPNDGLGDSKFPTTIGTSLDELHSVLGIVKEEVLAIPKDYTRNKTIVESIPRVFNIAAIQDTRAYGKKVLGTDIEADVNDITKSFETLENSVGGSISVAAGGVRVSDSGVIDIDIIQNEKAFDRVIDHYLGDKGKLLTKMPEAVKVSTVPVNPWTNQDINRSNPISADAEDDTKITAPWIFPDRQDTVDWGYI